MQNVGSPCSLQLLCGSCTHPPGVSLPSPPVPSGRDSHFGGKVFRESAGARHSSSPTSTSICGGKGGKGKGSPMLGGCSRTPGTGRAGVQAAGRRGPGEPLREHPNPSHCSPTGCPQARAALSPQAAPSLVPKNPGLQRQNLQHLQHYRYPRYPPHHPQQPQHPALFSPLPRRELLRRLSLGRGHTRPVYREPGPRGAPQGASKPQPRFSEEEKGGNPLRVEPLLGRSAPGPSPGLAAGACQGIAGREDGSAPAAARRRAALAQGWCRSPGGPQLAQGTPGARVCPSPCAARSIHSPATAGAGPGLWGRDHRGPAAPVPGVRCGARPWPMGLRWVPKGRNRSLQGHGVSHPFPPLPGQLWPLIPWDAVPGQGCGDRGSHSPQSPLSCPHKPPACSSARLRDGGDLRSPRRGTGHWRGARVRDSPSAGQAPPGREV